MGTHYQFICDHCGFKAEVSGGFDVGMITATQTITCQDCSNLMDIEVGDAPITKPEDVAKMTLRCPKLSRHNVTQWSHPGSCPKCGKTMTRGPITVHWD